LLKSHSQWRYVYTLYTELHRNRTSNGPNSFTI